MNPEDAVPSESLITLLDQLHDLHEPAQVSMWPATPAWIVLGLLVFAVLILCLRHWLHHRRATAYRRAALAELRGMQEDLARGRVPALARLDTLLRRTALAAFPRAEVAALGGPEWAAFLHRTGGEAIAAEVPAMAAATFSTASPDFDGKAALRAARDWIRHHHA